MFAHTFNQQHLLIVPFNFSRDNIKVIDFLNWTLPIEQDRFKHVIPYSKIYVEAYRKQHINKENSETIEQLKDVQQRANKLKTYLQIDEKRIQLEEEELHTQAPGFWDDAKAAEAQMRKVKGIKRWIEGYEGVRAAVEELRASLAACR